jgi:hypothetical protein
MAQLLYMQALLWKCRQERISSVVKAKEAGSILSVVLLLHVNDLCAFANSYKTESEK